MEDPEETQDGLQQSGMETLAADKAAKGSPGPHRIVVKPRSTDPEFPVKDWDRYAFVRFLGQGGMGRVYLARDKRLGREVAIKFVRFDDDRYVGRFMAEARTQARVDHPHVCKVFEVGEVEGKVFITMQHIKGLPLDVAALELSLEQKVMVLRDAAQGVHEAHRMGIIHRDLKPSNILVERNEDGSDHAYVMDFGLAHEWNTEGTETGSVLGTPAFMSPEQARGEVSRLDRRADVYSLGATLYQVITGKAPVAGTNALEILSAIASVDVQPMRAHRLDIPRDLEAITQKALEKDRARRYDSAKAFAEDLDRFLAGDPVLARPTGIWYRIQRKLRKHKQLTVVGAAALLLVFTAMGIALKTRRDASRRERLAQQFTESMARIESMARYSALSPLHDIRPDLKAVRTHMAQLQEEMKQAGTLANGPGHYALGRGYWTLDDDEKAREHLQMAWDAGFREPRAAYALAVVIGRQYQERLLEAERIPSADQREARKQEIESALRTPALTFLRQARGSDAPSPAYLAALMAFYEGRLDEALTQLKTLGDDLSWFYEAPLLRGSLLQARAWKRWNQGDREGAHADFESGREALALAGASGRSAPAVHAALAELEQNALFMEKYGQGRVEPVYARGMAAVRTALTAQPDHAPSLILQAALMGNLAESKMDHGEKADDLIQEAVTAATKAVEAGPTRVDARVALGKAYFQWGNARQDQNLDPTDQLDRGLHAFESLSFEKRDYTVENHLGLIHQTWSDFEDQNGRDPLGHLNGAIAAYQMATRMEPHLLPAWINLGTCLHKRGTLPKASDPEGDLQAALRVLDQAHTLNPKHFVPYFVQSRVHFDVAQRKRAQGEDPSPDLRLSIQACRAGIDINPKIPHLHNGVALAQIELAHTAWDNGEDPTPLLDQALASTNKAIAVAPGQVYGYRILGDLLIWKARIDEGAGSAKALQQAESTVRKSIAVLPGNKESLAMLGRVYAVRIEKAVPGEGVAVRDYAPGEASLAKALALDPRDRDSLQYLGELRSAAAKSKALHHQAESKDFDRAAESFGHALEASPNHQETLLALSHLCLDRAKWERALGRDSSQSLTQARSWLDRILKHRPRWGEGIALRAALNLEEAERQPPGNRAVKSQEALQDFRAAFSLNRNLASEWKPWEKRAQQLEEAVP